MRDSGVRRCISPDAYADPAEDLFCVAKTGCCVRLATANAGWEATDERLPAGTLHLSEGLLGCEAIRLRHSDVLSRLYS